MPRAVAPSEPATATAPRPVDPPAKPDEPSTPPATSAAAPSAPEPAPPAAAAPAAPMPAIASAPPSVPVAPPPLDARALAARGLDRELKGDRVGAIADLRAALAAESDLEHRQGIRNLLDLLDAPR
jgi:hypothetical protein